MQKIFEDSKEPLFGRADKIVRLKPFSITELHSILKQHGREDVEALFSYYLISGGVPKYIEQLITEEAFSEDQIFDTILSEHSLFLHEGKSILIEEFGKEYGMYFSILELIASGKTNRTEIESVLQKDIGGYLERLERYYGIIEKYRPITAKSLSKSVRYRIQDLFLKFWFRFIFNNWSAVEAANFLYIKDIVSRDLSTYKGPVLEEFFKALFHETKKFNRIGTYWEHGNQNEIDLVAINDLNKIIVIGEIKLNKDRIRLEGLRKKADKLLKVYSEYTPKFLALTLKDATDFLSA